MQCALQCVLQCVAVCVGFDIARLTCSLSVQVFELREVVGLVRGWQLIRG